MAHQPNHRPNSRVSSWRANERPAFDRARDELFAQVSRCRVMDALPEHQAPWFDDAVQYLEETYPQLSKAELTQLRQAGERFATPAKRAPSAEIA
jgi:hypothetical protein